MKGRNSGDLSRRRARAFGGTLVSAAALLSLTSIGHAQVTFSGSYTDTPPQVVIGGGSAGSLTLTGPAATLSVAGSGTTSAGVLVGTTTSGGMGDGTVLVQEGGTIAIDSDVGSGGAGFSVGVNNGTIGSVTVTGSGSTLEVTGIDDNVKGDGYTIGSAGTGTLDVFNGGTVIEDNTGTAAQGGMSIGGSPRATGASGTGTVTVSGTSSSGTDATIDLESANANLGVGYAGTGTLNVDQGGSVTTTNTYVGELSGSTGSVNVSGGTLTTQNLYMGYSGGSSTGTVTINEGGMVDISPPSGTQPYIDLGSNSVASTGGSGTLTVNGGSLNVSSGSVAPIIFAGGGTGSTGAITVENGGQMTGLFQVIVGGAGNGSLSVLGSTGNNTTMLFSNTNPSTGDEDEPVLVIGGDGPQVSNSLTAGTGTVTVSGRGASISFSAPNGLVITGYSGNGSLNVNNGGAISAEQLNVGQLADSNGNVTISGKGSSLTLSGSNSINNSGAQALIGESGTGIVTVSNGAALTIDATNTGAGTPAGIVLGGNGSQAGGTGVLTVSGGSTVNIDNTAGGVVLSIGRNGTGTVTVNDSTVDVNYESGAVGGVYVGALASASSAAATAPMVGTLTVADGSTLNTGGILAVADDRTTSDTSSGHVGTGTVTVSDSTVIANQIYVGSTNSTSPPSGTASLIMTNNATITGSGSSSANVFVGQNGIFGGNGTLNGNVTNEGGILQVGASPDPLTITGSYSQTGGTIDLVVDSNGSGGYALDSLIFDDPTAIDISDVDFVFNFGPGVDPTSFFNSLGSNDTGMDVLEDFILGPGGDTLSDTDFSDIFTADSDDTFTATSTDYTINNFDLSPNGETPTVEETSVPEPGSLALFATALIGLAVRLRWRRKAG